MAKIQHQAQKIRYRQKPKDKYYTPKPLAKRLVEYTLPYLKYNDVVCDPCKGKGAFYDNYPNFVKKEWFEIDDGKDFFTGLATKKYDWIITNPPYSELNRWLKKICYSCREGFALLLAEHAITPRRLEFIESMGYGMVFMHYVKIMQWYGLSVFVIFRYGFESLISYETKIYQDTNSVFSDTLEE